MDWFVESVPPKADRTRRRWCSSRRPSTCAWRRGGVFDVELVEDRAGFCLLRVSGKQAELAFAREGGGHRWQRVPPGEKRESCTPAPSRWSCLPAPAAVDVVIDERDLRWSTCRASGNGGQHLQKTESAVQVTHVPTGLHVRCESERSQHQNRATAMALLRARMLAAAQRQAKDARDQARRDQAGHGERGDKRRTIRQQDGLVHDHETGQTWSFRDYERGKWELAEQSARTQARKGHRR